jgi:allantoinase
VEVRAPDPPSANRDRLWEALAAGDVDLVAVRPLAVPAPAEGGDWFTAWGGIASLQLGLRVVWTAARARGLGPERVAEWMCAAPARLAGLVGRKGSIAVGCDADLVVWDPDSEATVRPDVLHHRHKVTPYAGGVFAGEVLATYVRGVQVYDRGRFPDQPAGRILLRDIA